ncbi:radical SAM protein [Desulfothermobacter acidiphilus]|uniref:radical SAM protein n=1 Tax=Desulfothermobacter acidiphilus TaxID=1938353 RepID=UPI003F8A40F4
MSKWSSSLPSFDFAKRFVSEQILRQMFNYVDRDPEQNFPRILALAKKVAKQPHHKAHTEKIAAWYESNPAVRFYINRLFERTHPNVKRRLVYNWFVNAMLLGIPRQQDLSAKLGVHIPNFFLMDPTSDCNLRCEGCWAGMYQHHDTLEFETLDRIINEAKELGIYWIVMSGGEPFKYPRLLELAGRHPDTAFMVYTNGTLITERVADSLVEIGNLSPAISLEGWREETDARRGKGVFDRIMRAMDLLRERGLIFGASITITRNNLDTVTSDEFIDFLVDKGVTYAWTFHYVPVGRNPNPELMITPEQRAYLARRIPYLRTHKPIQIADFWNDGELTGGCIAGGRMYFHITAKGDVEPCAFAHFSVDNIKEKSLLEVLRNPLFAAYQKRQPFCPNLLCPCPIIDNPQALRDIVAESGARPTHPGAESILQEPIASYLDRRAEAWRRLADEIWAERHGAKEEVKSGSR